MIEKKICQEFNPEKDLCKQLHLDLYGSDMELLDQVSLWEKFLTDFPKKIGMTILAGPHIMNACPEVIEAGKMGKSKEVGGSSGFVVISESHISYHAWPAYGQAQMDVYSCKEFDANFVVEYVTKLFRPKKVEYNVLVRGKDFLKPMEDRLEIQVL